MAKKSSSSENEFSAKIENQQLDLFSDFTPDDTSEPEGSSEYELKFISTSDVNYMEFGKKVQAILDNIVAEQKLPNKCLVYEVQNNKYADDDAMLNLYEPPYPLTDGTSGYTQTSFLPVKWLRKQVNRVAMLTNYVELSVKRSVFAHIQLPTSAIVMGTDKSEFRPVRFAIEDPTLFTYIKDIVEFRLKNYSSAKSAFACCDKFADCSKAGYCLHENRLYSTGCKYRAMHLDKGERLYK